VNNEPIAWMMENPQNTSAYLTFEKPTREMKISHQAIPLYTHPTDESFDRTASHMAGEYVSYPAKTLTDEEIANIFAEHTKIAGTYDVKDIIFPFARAILRKAQEK